MENLYFGRYNYFRSSQMDDTRDLGFVCIYSVYLLSVYFSVGELQLWQAMSAGGDAEMAADAGPLMFLTSCLYSCLHRLYFYIPPDNN